MQNKHIKRETDNHPYRLWDRVRLINFTDAIFAIAITLLAFNLHLPEGAGSFGTRLYHIHDGVLGFFISFAVIGYIWLGHNRMFHYIKEVDRRTFLLHLAFLATVSFLPFASNALENNSGDRGAVIFYSASVFAVVAMQLVIWLYVRRHPALLDPELEPRTISFITAVSSYTPIVFLISIIAALFSAAAGQYVLLALIVERAVLRYYYHVKSNQAE